MCDMKRTALLLCLLLASPLAAQDKTSKKGVKYFELGPRKARPGLPLVLALHGDGYDAKTFRGDMASLANAWNAWVLVPEKSSGASGNGWGGDAPKLIALVKEFAAARRVPARQVVVLGHSSGGGVGLQVARGLPRLASAWISLAGPAAIDAESAKALKGMGIYLSHGSADTIVKPDSSQALHKALKAAGVDVTLSVIKGHAHSTPWPGGEMKAIGDWVRRWLATKARLVRAPGESAGILEWAEASEAEALRDDARPGLIYFYAKDKGKHPTLQWIEWDVLHEEAVAKATGDFTCLRVPLSDAIAKRYKAKKPCLVVKSKKKKLKVLAKPVPMKKLLKELAKASK
jgi:predicted esterase